MILFEELNSLSYKNCADTLKEPSQLIPTFSSDSESNFLSRLFNEKVKSLSPQSRHYNSTQSFVYKSSQKMFGSQNRISISRKSIGGLKKLTRDLSATISQPNGSKANLNPEEDTNQLQQYHTIDNKASFTMQPAKNGLTGSSIQKSKSSAQFQTVAQPSKSS